MPCLLPDGNNLLTQPNMAVKYKVVKSFQALIIGDKIVETYFHLKALGVKNLSYHPLFTAFISNSFLFYCFFEKEINFGTKNLRCDGKARKLYSRNIHPI